MTEKIIIAGFGGQGVILAGKLLAYTGMIEGKFVSHIPSYGAEMRGGTANCSVIISDREIASPLISKPTTIIVMNPPSLTKFEERVIEKGKIFINSSLIDDKVKRNDTDVYYVPSNDIAEKAGSGRSSNMVMVGAYIAVTEILDKENVKNSLPYVISKRNLKYNEINFRAIDMGYDFAKEKLLV